MGDGLRRYDLDRHGYIDFGTKSGHGYLTAAENDVNGTGLWVAGTLWQTDPVTGAQTPEPYLLHYDATTGEWQRRKLPPVVGTTNDAFAVDAEGGVLIGVALTPGGEGGDLLLHYNGDYADQWTEPQHEGAWTYGAASYVPGTKRLWLAGCTLEESGRPITGIAAYASVPLKH